MEYNGILNLLQSIIGRVSSEEQSKPKTIEFFAENGEPNKAEVEENTLDGPAKPDHERWKYKLRGERKG